MKNGPAEIVTGSHCETTEFDLDAQDLEDDSIWFEITGFTGDGQVTINETTGVCTSSNNPDNWIGETLPSSHLLGLNYPNPFNPVTTIEYSVPARSMVEISVYNILGQHVRSLVDEVKSAGTFTTLWDGRDQSGRDAATGIYFYRLRAGDQVETKKMLLLK